MIIYALISPSNKIYIGQTIESLEKRWADHKKQAKYGKPYPIRKAILKYGSENFLVQQIAVAHTQEELDNLEKIFIILFNSRDTNYGYNLRSGGSRGKHSEETKQKMSISAKGRVFSEETILKMKKSAVGRIVSEETKFKLREARKNSTYDRTGVGKGSKHGPRSEEWKTKQSLLRKGKPWSDARRAAQNRLIDARKSD